MNKILNDVFENNGIDIIERKISKLESDIEDSRDRIYSGLRTVASINNFSLPNKMVELMKFSVDQFIEYIKENNYQDFIKVHDSSTSGSIKLELLFDKVPLRIDDKTTTNKFVDLTVYLKIDNVLKTLSSNIYYSKRNRGTASHLKYVRSVLNVATNIDNILENDDVRDLLECIKPFNFNETVVGFRSVGTCASYGYRGCNNFTNYIIGNNFGVVSPLNTVKYYSHEKGVIVGFIEYLLEYISYNGISIASHTEGINVYTDSEVELSEPKYLEFVQKPNYDDIGELKETLEEAMNTLRDVLSEEN